MCTVLFAVAFVGSFFIASCSSSSDDDEPVTNKVTKIKAEYSISLDEDWYKFFDIEVTYTSATGSTTTETLTQDWIYSTDMPVEAAPSEYTCKVVAKPKANAPAIEEGKTYKMGVSCTAKVAGYYGNGTQDADYGMNGTKSSNKELSAQGMEKYLQGEHSVFSFSYSPNK